MKFETNDWLPLTIGLPVIALVTALAFISFGLWRSRGSTLVGPMAWAICAVTCLGLVELLVITGALDDVWTSRFRYVAACSTLCPGVALLGAKRPQYRSWHFIVASLWIVLTVPALQNIAFSSDAELELDAAWSWFLVITIVIQWFNHIGTRLWLPSTLVATGQFIWLNRFLPLGVRIADEIQFTAGLLLIVAAMGLAMVRFRRPSSFNLDETWLNFRDAYGVVWALRIRDRLNHLADQERWPVRLTWMGFVATDGATDPIPWEEIERCFGNLLRRFVAE
jgi:hypothetical protein